MVQRDSCHEEGDKSAITAFTHSPSALRLKLYSKAEFFLSPKKQEYFAKSRQYNLAF